MIWPWMHTCIPRLHTSSRFPSCTSMGCRHLLRGAYTIAETIDTQPYAEAAFEVLHTILCIFFTDLFSRGVSPTRLKVLMSHSQLSCLNHFNKPATVKLSDCALCFIDICTPPASSCAACAPGCLCILDVSPLHASFNCYSSLVQARPSCISSAYSSRGEMVHCSLPF